MRVDVSLSSSVSGLLQLLHSTYLHSSRQYRAGAKLQAGRLASGSKTQHLPASRQ